MKKSFLWTVIIAAVLMTSMMAYGVSFWPQFKGNAGHTGVVPHSIGCKNTTEWTLDVNGGPFLMGCMLDGNDNVIFLTESGYVYSISPSGSMNWCLNTNATGNWGGVAYSDAKDTIYATLYGASPEFLAIDASTGSVKWNYASGSDDRWRSCHRS